MGLVVQTRAENRMIKTSKYPGARHPSVSVYLQPILTPPILQSPTLAITGSGTIIMAKISWTVESENGLLGVECCCGLQRNFESIIP